MDITQSKKNYGLISVMLSAISLVGMFSIVMLVSAPVGIVYGILAVKHDEKKLGIIGIAINSILIFGLILLMLWFASGPQD